MQNSDIITSNLKAELDRMLVMYAHSANVEKSDIELQGFYLVPRSFSGFAGHFPGYPVLPALMQSLMLRHLSEKILGYDLVCLEIKNAKFTGQGKPDDLLHITLLLTEDKQTEIFKADAIMQRCPTSGLCHEWKKLSGEELKNSSPWTELSQQRFILSRGQHAQNLF